MDHRHIEIDVAEDRFPTVEIFTPAGIEELGFNFQEMFSGMIPKKTKKRKVSVGEAQKILSQEEVGRLVDMEEVVSTALERVENSGIIFAIFRPYPLLILDDPYLMPRLAMTCCASTRPLHITRTMRRLGA